jgi:hypothetical protein
MNKTKDKRGAAETVPATFQVQKPVWEQMHSLKEKTKTPLQYLMHEALTDFLAKKYQSDLPTRSLVANEPEKRDVVHSFPRPS